MSSPLESQGRNLDTLQAAVVAAERRSLRRTILVVAFLICSALLIMWTFLTYTAKQHFEWADTVRQIEQIQQIQKPLTETKDAQIAALTKLLLEKNPEAAPGAEQAVGAAIGSIAQGAAKGDVRLQQALDLLKENKIADATRLLNAVMVEKTARAEKYREETAKDRKDAAVAYRNLGAIARIADPKRALEAYEKAVELDPDDLDSLYWAGLIFRSITAISTKRKPGLSVC
jgi:tetratricopeptide (TPR) repeat protein